MIWNVSIFNSSSFLLDCLFIFIILKVFAICTLGKWHKHLFSINSILPIYFQLDMLILYSSLLLLMFDGLAIYTLRESVESPILLPLSFTDSDIWNMSLAILWTKFSTFTLINSLMISMQSIIISLVSSLRDFICKTNNSSTFGIAISSSSGYLKC